MVKKILAVMIAILIAISCCYYVCAKEENAKFVVGDIVEFGSYPQTEITDENLKQALNAVEATAKGFEGYYEAELRGPYGDKDYVENKNMMFYKDVTYNGEKYRGIKISSYRPSYTNLVPAKNNTAQSYYGYDIGEWYWFKYEPLKWKIFDAEKSLAISEIVIDSQPYNSIYKNNGYECINFSTNIEYANNFGTSTLCKWLNSDFLNTAFTPEEQKLLPEITVDTHFADGTCGQNRGAASFKQVVLLTHEQAKDPNSDSDYAVKEEFIFGDDAKSYEESFSDYAAIQGYDRLGWWLVTPYIGSTDQAESVFVNLSEGTQQYSILMNSTVNDASTGVRPVISFSQITEEYDVGNTTDDTTSAKGNSVFAVLIGAIVVLGIVSGIAVLIIKKKK